MKHIDEIQFKTQLALLTEEQLATLNARAEWYKKLARPNQLPPKDQSTWDTWLLQAGRGFGKTRSAVEWLWWEAYNDPGSYNHVVVRRSEDLEKVAFEGPSGLFRRIPSCIIADRTRSPHRIRLKNDAVILGFSADDPDVLRGPECHRAWCDELAAWRRIDAAWNDGVVMGTRLSSARNKGRPKRVITTTPRPIKFLARLRDAPGTVISRGTTYENAANLAPATLAEFERLYKGTRRGKQELYGELLEDIPGALWKLIWIEHTRMWEKPVDLVEVVIGVDPATTSEEGSNETGIIGAARDRQGRGYVLADRSDTYSPEEWGIAAVNLHDQLEADHVTVEVNQGGEMCRSVLFNAAKELQKEGKRRSGSIVVKMVHASRGKETRAEPVSQFYEQGRVSHVGEFVLLEEQMVNFTKAFDRKRLGSPDRLDAMVWAFTDLLVDMTPSLEGFTAGNTAVSKWKGAHIAFSSGKR